MKPRGAKPYKRPNKKPGKTWSLCSNVAAIAASCFIKYNCGKNKDDSFYILLFKSV